MSDTTASNNNPTVPCVAGYLHTDWSTHFYTNVDMIIASIEMGCTKQDILVGLRNTIKEGYELRKIND